MHCSNYNPVLKFISDNWGLTYIGNIRKKEKVESSIPSIYALLQNTLLNHNKYKIKINILYNIYALGCNLYFKYEERQKITKLIISANVKYYDLYAIIFLIFLCHIEESRTIKNGSFESVLGLLK